MQKTIVLDFHTITNPQALLHALTIYRATYGRLTLNRFAARLDLPSHPLGQVCIVDEKYSGAYSEQRKKDYFGHEALEAAAAASGHDVNDCRLLPTNLPLAVKLMQHASREGIVDVYEYGLSVVPLFQLKKDAYEFIWNIFETLSPKTRQKFVSHAFLGNNVKSRCTLHDDIFAALPHYWDFTIDAKGFDTLDTICKRTNTLASSGIVRSVLSSMQFGSFSDYTHLIDKPSIFMDAIEMTKRVVNESDYHKEVRWWLPNAAADLATLGTAGPLRMLWKIFKRNIYKSQHD